MGVEIMLALQIAGVAAGAAGAATQYQGQKKQAEASKEAEGLRKKQMELESTRKQRELIRHAQLARSRALTTTTAQTGSSATSGSSALPGAYGQIEADTSRSLNFEQSSLSIGRGIFDANAQYATAGSMVAMGGAVSTIGSALIKTSGPLSEMSTSLLFGKSEKKQTTTKEWGYM